MLETSQVEPLTLPPRGHTRPPEVHALGSVALAFPSEFVRRPRLVRRLVQARDRMLALIVAPPGYGKSTLLADWAEQDDRPFVWPGFGSSDSPSAITDSFLSTGSVAGPGNTGCVAVIDDAHLLDPDVLRAAVQEIWKQLPPDSVVAVASRTEPELPLGRLRAHRALVEVRLRDLAMSGAEAASLLRRAGFRLAPESIETLVRQTEGWPVALYLAGLSLARQPDAPVAVAGYRGDDHLLVEYLRDEVIGGLPDALVTFLRRSSVADHLSGDLCDTLLNEYGSGAMLAQAARMTELLEPIDPAHEGYRFHPLFRECMHAELRRAEPGLQSDLQRRASHWHAQRGDAEAAIEHAAAAGDPALTGALLWEHIVEYLTGGRIERVRSWLRGFTDEAIAGNATLAMCAAQAAVFSGDAESAQRWVRHAAADTTRGKVRLQSYAAAVTTVEAMAASGGIAAMQRGAARVRKSEAQDSQWRTVCDWLEGVARHLGGSDREVAVKLLEGVIETSRRELPTVTTLALAQRAMMAMEDKDWELAEEITDEARAAIEESGVEEPIVAFAYAAAAAARAHEGRADEAKHDLRAGIEALTDLGDSLTWYGAQTRILLAHASLYLADVVGARTLLAQASRLARRLATAVAFEAWFDEAWSYLDTLAETSLTGPSALTIAELRVLRFLPSCRPFREIADQLGVSANTVKTQAHAVYRKLGAASRSEAVAQARAAGLLGQ